MSGFPEFVWAANSQSVSLKTYLPLDVVDPAERKERAKEEIPVEVGLRTRELRQITDKELTDAITRKNQHFAGIEVSFVKDIHPPPRILSKVPLSKTQDCLIDL